jgi:hypothetical protein
MRINRLFLSSATIAFILCQNHLNGQSPSKFRTRSNDNPRVAPTGKSHDYFIHWISPFL